MTDMTAAFGKIVADGENLAFVPEPGFLEGLGWEVGAALDVTLLAPGVAVVRLAAPAVA